MGKIRNFNTLTALDKLFDGKNKLPAAPTRTHALLLILREICKKLRTDENKLFYTSRQVAAFFRIPQTTVIKVFAQLEEEGLLLRLRSSGTFLKAKQKKATIPVRGVVGIVMWHVAYCNISSWRAFYFGLEEELRKHHYLANIIFLGNKDPGQSGFVNRLLNHNLDYLVWYNPLKIHHPILGRLTDNGIKTALVHNAREFTLPFSEYTVDWIDALRKCIRQWEASGVTEIYSIGDGTFIKNKTLIEEGGLKWTAIAPEISFNQIKISVVLDEILKRKNIGLIASDFFWFTPRYDFFSRIGRDFSGNGRILFLDHSELFHSLMPPLKYDILWSDPVRIGRKVAQDIIQDKMPKPGTPFIFKPEYLPKVSLNNYSVYY